LVGYYTYPGSFGKKEGAQKVGHFGTEVLNGKNKKELFGKSCP